MGLLRGAYRYTFTSSIIRQVVDNQGIVHDTFAASLYSVSRTYYRATWCASALWHQLEPINSCDETVTTCLSCLGAQYYG